MIALALVIVIEECLQFGFGTWQTVFETREFHFSIFVREVVFEQLNTEQQLRLELA